jgi:hypothetical protein
VKRQEEEITETVWQIEKGLGGKWPDVLEQLYGKKYGYVGYPVR